MSQLVKLVIAYGKHFFEHELIIKYLIVLTDLPNYKLIF